MLRLAGNQTVHARLAAVGEHAFGRCTAAATFIVLVVANLTIATPAAAQDPYDRDPRVVGRERVRDVIPRNVLVKETARAYQGRDRGPEQTERFSRKIRIGRDGRVSIQN